MKEVEVETVVDDCTAKLYYDAIYGTADCMRTFHAKVNADPNAAVGPWGPDGSRTVNFVMPMNVPAMLKKFIGMDSVPVVEVQKVEWQPDRAGFKVVSEPQLNFPGANKFTTSGYLDVSSRPDGSCLVKALIRCSAGMPWPVQATVEGLMASEAVASIGTFLGFCKDYYAKWRAEQTQQPERPAPPQPPAATAAAVSLSGGDQFYDAVDDEAELAGAGAGAGTAAEAAAGPVVPYTPPRLEDVIVDCLRQIQASSSETAQTLRSMEELLRNMDDNMQVLRDKLVGRRPQPTSSTSRSTGAATTTTASRSTAAQPTASYGSTALRLVTVVSLVCAAGAFTYVRYRTATGGGGGGGGK